MNLTDAQKQTVKRWLDEGLTLAEVQKRLETELSLRMTYMEVRMLMADLSLMPKDIEPRQLADLAPKNAPAGTTPTMPRPGAGAPAAEDWPPETPDTTPPLGGGVEVRVDQITRPGSVVSGSVKFSDGQSAQWYLDQMGRLGLMPGQQGYRPSAADVQAFQMALEGELRKLGM